VEMGVPPPADLTDDAAMTIEIPEVDKPRESQP
jgi:hypothetical protein